MDKAPAKCVLPLRQFRNRGYLRTARLNKEMQTLLNEFHIRKDEGSQKPLLVKNSVWSCTTGALSPHGCRIHILLHI